MTTSRRHLLVIAPQCRAKGSLDRLEKAAHALRQVLTDDAIGACVPGLPDGRSVLYGDVSSGEIRDRFDEAIQYASEEGAALILALLGHGFTPDETTLYLLGDSGREGAYPGSIEVGALLREAADTQEIDGVIGIVDTCFALGAQSRLQELANGLRGGRVRLSLLMASLATEQAIDLRFSLGLAELLKQGLPGAGPELRVGDVIDELRRRVIGQTIARVEYDGDALADSPLWLARNVGYSPGPLEDLLGPAGRQELGAAWRALDPQADFLNGPWDNQTLRHVRRDMARRDGPRQWQRARRAVTNAYIAQVTVNFLRSLGLKTSRLSHALAALWADEGWLSPVPPSPRLVDAVDQVAFCYPESHPDCRAWMAKFVWMMMSEAGVEADDDRLVRWADAIDAQQEVADAMEPVRKMRERQRLRLVISLPSLAGDWPQTLEAWLYWDEKLCEHESFPCQTVDQPGTENALRDVLGWAHPAAYALGHKLRRVDIAVPSALLLTWQPEKVDVGIDYLGINHDVLNHWSERLSPPRTLWWIRQAWESRLEKMANCVSGAPLDWLAESIAREHGTLLTNLRQGWYMRAVGLAHHPDTKLMDLLLPYIPIVLWPQTEVEAGFPAERHGSLNGYWGLLPGGLMTAYRKRWAGKDAGDLADLRAVWDDQEWMDFCERFGVQPQAASEHRERS
jgi:hypothetical protein